jgi:hypothetical protein
VSAARLALPLAAVALLAGCGGSYSDLLAVRRTGSLPDARFQFVINDGGTISCQGGRERPLAAKLLLEARDIVRALQPQFEDNRPYPPSPDALLEFRAQTADGDLAFADVDGARDRDVARLVALTRRVAQRACGLPR